MTFTVEVNSTVTVTVKGTGAGLTGVPDLVLLKNGAVDVTTPVNFSSVGAQSLYNLSFVPVSTGLYTLHAFGEIVYTIQVVSKSVYNFLQNIEDEALGSWQWDKSAGTLVMLRQDSTTLAQFTVVDNLTTSSRERTS